MTKIEDPLYPRPMERRATSAPQADDSAGEAKLLERALGGDATAYSLLVRLYHRRVRAYLATCLHDLDAADDLAQEVFIAAFRSLASRSPDAPFALWLLGIARNRARWYLRDEGSRMRRTDSLEPTLRLWLARMVDDPAPAVLERELVALEHCLAELPAPSSALVGEHYFRRRPLADLARELGRKESALRMTLLRIRKLLRECVARQLTEEP